MRHKYIWVDIIANINNLKNVYQQIRCTIPFKSIYNFNIKFLIINKLVPNVLNRVPWVLY